MPYRIKDVVHDDTNGLSLTGIAAVAVGLIAVVIANLTGSDSLESLVAFIAATYGASEVMPYRIK
jgi:hypothetical protein